MSGQAREYRQIMMPEGLSGMDLVDGESDLRVFTSGPYPLIKAQELLARCRRQIRDYIEKDPNFLTSLVPVHAQPDSPEIVIQMVRAAERMGVGPMAAVAGAVAQYLGAELSKNHSEVIIENGGDIYIKSSVPRRVLIHAGESPFSDRLALELPGGTWGVCTSSGTVGHSLSFGFADAVVVVSRDTLLADAAATALGNMVKSESDVGDALGVAAKIDGVEGVLIIIGRSMGAWGDITIINPQEQSAGGAKLC